MWSSCSQFNVTTCILYNVKDPILSIHSMTINPTTLQMGRELSLSFEATVHRSITSNLNFDVTVKKNTWLGYIRVPCVFKLGSCSYKFCDLLSSKFATEGVQCPLLIDKSNANCTCPFQPGTYKVDKETLKMPTITGFGFAVSGTYNMKAKLVDTKTKHVAGCYEMTFSIQA
ncbi:hypothetical protein ACJMK2_029256 [Sinanodonta woodiana]|uniref:MD-2-related lipid-recognition domain-containing protein n=1 Tax=Sinanodonta woodiana TaxID=1069815 RepID=A0ABD3XDG5_SINWO